MLFTLIPRVIVVHGQNSTSAQENITPEQTITRIYKSLDVEIIEYIIKIFQEDAQDAIRIFRCESSLKPEAYNPETKAKEKGITKYGSYGIAQLNRPFNERLYDYRFNITEAKKLYDNRGWSPWACK